MAISRIFTGCGKLLLPKSNRSSNQASFGVCYGQKEKTNGKEKTTGHLARKLSKGVHSARKTGRDTNYRAGLADAGVWVLASEQYSHGGAVTPKIQQGIIAVTRVRGNFTSAS